MKARTGILAITLLALEAPSWGQSNVQTREALTNRAIVTLAGAGFNEDFIIELIANSRTEFDTSINELAGLAKQGINERIIRAMLAAAAANPDARPTAAETSAPPDPGGRPRVMVLNPKPTTIAMSTHTPYYGQVSVLWGLFRRSVGIGAGPPQSQDAMASHLGIVYGSVLSSGAALTVAH